MDIILIKKPNELGFSGNSLPFSWAFTPYTDVERNLDIYVMVRLYVETGGYGTEIFTEENAQPIYPDNDGFVNLDTRTIIDTYLKFFQPKKKQNSILQGEGQITRYYLSFQINNQGNVGTLNKTDYFTAIKGTISVENWPIGYVNLPTTQIIPLYRADITKKVMQTDLNWLYFIAPKSVKIGVKFTLTFENGNTRTKTISFDDTLYNADILCVPIGIDQMKLTDIVPDGRSIVNYQVDIINSDTNVVLSPASKILEVDDTWYYKTRQLIFRDSLGGLDSVNLTGDMELSADYNRINAVRVMAPMYYRDLIMRPQNIVSSSEETFNITGQTGWLTEKEAMQLRSLFTSTEAWELNKESGKIVPIALTAKTIKFYTVGDSLIQLEIEYSYAFTNMGFSADDYSPMATACPALESLQAVQISKNLIQIFYSIPIPYDRVELSLTMNSVTTIYDLTGNVGRKPIYFDQVSANTTATITAKIICDAFSDPVSEGPITSISLNVIRYMPPVVNNETYKTSMNVPILSYGSITINGGGANETRYQNYTDGVNYLDNDYSIDGDIVTTYPSTNIFKEIEGTTNSGGTWKSSRGYLNYYPPLDFVGIDYFDYQVMAGLSEPVTGRCTIEVGNVANSRIYVKLVVEDLGLIGRGNRAARYTAFFYSDSSGSKPLDTTGLGLTLKYNKVVTNNGTDTTTNMTIAMTGTSILLYTGLVGLVSNVTKYVLAPGTGYLLLN